MVSAGIPAPPAEPGAGGRQGNSKAGPPRASCLLSYLWRRPPNDTAAAPGPDWGGPAGSADGDVSAGAGPQVQRSADPDPASRLRQLTGHRRQRQADQPV